MSAQWSDLKRTAADTIESLPLIVACCLWTPNVHSFPFSRCYDESWVDKLYRGWRRNLTCDFEFVCLTDREREFAEPVRQVKLDDSDPDYSSMLEPFRFCVSRPVIATGLDTVIVGNCDVLAEYCFSASKIAVPRDPFFPDKACNAVVLAPRGSQWLWCDHDGTASDMEWIRQHQKRLAWIDDIAPGACVSYKAYAKRAGVSGAKIVYFHGEEKPHEIDEEFVTEHWT